MTKPTTYREYIRALRDAYKMEPYVVGSGERYPGEIAGAIDAKAMDDVGGGGSKSGGTPMSGGGSMSGRGWVEVWRPGYEQYVSKDAWEIDEDRWRWPLRSSLARMSVSESENDRVSSIFIFLICQNRFHVRNAWFRLCGPFVNLVAGAAAESFASDSVRRWWRFYVELPTGERRTL